MLDNQMAFWKVKRPLDLFLSSTHILVGLQRIQSASGKAIGDENVRGG